MEIVKCPQAMPDSHQEDIRPCESPYAGPTVTVYFGSGDAFHIPRRIWLKCPELVSKRQQAVERKVDVFGRCGQLSDIPVTVGHILVNYLFTGNYESLTPEGVTYKDRISWELRTAVQAACASQAYNLPGLGDLANSEIKRLGDELDILHVTEIIEETNQPPIHLPGVADYLDSRLCSLCENLTASVADELLVALNKPTKTSQILLKSIILFQVRALERSKEKIDTDRTGGVMGVSEDAHAKDSSAAELAEFFSLLMNRRSIRQNGREEEISEEVLVKGSEPVAENECPAEVRDEDDEINESAFQRENPIEDEKPFEEEASAETIAAEESTSEIDEVGAYEEELMALKKKELMRGELDWKDRARYKVLIWKMGELSANQAAKGAAKEEACEEDEPAQAEVAEAATAEEAYSGWAESAKTVDVAENAEACQDEESAPENVYLEDSASPEDDILLVLPPNVHDFGVEDICPGRSIHLTVDGGWKTCATCPKVVRRFSKELVR